MDNKRLDRGDKDRENLADLLKNEVKKEPIGISEAKQTANEQGYNVTRDQVNHLMDTLANEGEIQSKKFKDTKSSPKVYFTTNHTTATSTNKETTLEK